ncbi:MAG: type II secretion system F family protein [Pseudomonadota bacterium]
MPDFVSSEYFTDGPVMVYILLFALGFLIVQSVSGLFSQAKMNKQLNRRLKAKERAGSVEQLIIQLRKERALSEDGELSMSSRWFNQLVTRAAIPFEPGRWAMMAGLAGLCVGGVLFHFLGNIIIALVASVAVFIAAPIYILSTLGKRRTAKLAVQLPDSLAVIVRSLEAGHPVPTAISLVGSEMPDPIGTEFGMLADEMTYGSSLKDAVRRLAERTCSPDVDLFAATIRLQQKTGGNLAELLKLIAAAIRDRQTLRLKVKAASSEGRMSALILTCAPFVVGGGMHLMNPEYYGEVLHLEAVQYWLGGFVVWMGIGNLVMRKMINFKI